MFIPPFEQDFVTTSAGERVPVYRIVDGGLRIEASFGEELTIRRNGRARITSY